MDTITLRDEALVLKALVKGNTKGLFIHTDLSPEEAAFFMLWVYRIEDELSIHNPEEVSTLNG